MPYLLPFHLVATFSGHIAMYLRSPVTTRLHRWYLRQVTRHCLKVEVVPANNAVHFRKIVICEGLQYVAELVRRPCGIIEDSGLWHI